MTPTETAATPTKTQDERDSEQLNAQLLRSLESPVEQECEKALAVGQAHAAMTAAQAELEKREDIAERWKAVQVRINRRHADLTAELAAARATQTEAVLATAFDTPEVLNFKWSLKDLAPLLNEHAALAQVLNELPRRIRATDRDLRIGSNGNFMNALRNFPSSSWALERFLLSHGKAS